MAAVIPKALLLFLWVLIYSCEANPNNIKVKSRYYPRFHLSPPYGWMNDPNGFSVFKGEYHIFYQFDPKSSYTAGNIHWGHAKSKDLMSWEHLPIALYPDEPYDKDGVFSGSTIVENDTMYVYYTGRIFHAGATPDHEEHQALAISTDGIHFTKFPNNPVVIAPNLQPDIRDPKVWKHGDSYYMVIGNSIKEKTGSIVLFKSDDKINWEQVSVLATSDGSMGYMFECPDFFELNGRYVLLWSPQGIKPDGDKYLNDYQVGYFVGRFDYETYQFIPETPFKELDNGHDFYASHTTLDHHGRRLVVAWMDMWYRNYPEQKDGFNGYLTLPRVLSLDRQGNIIQTPVQEIAGARDKVIYSGVAKADLPIVLPDKAGEILVQSTRNTNLVVSIAQQGNSTNGMTITYDPKKGTVTLERVGKDPCRRTKWRPRVREYLNWRIFVDASSVELFCGRGEVTFSSRFFPDGPTEIRVSSSKVAAVNVLSLRRTVQVPDDK